MNTNGPAAPVYFPRIGPASWQSWGRVGRWTDHVLLDCTFIYACTWSVRRPTLHMYYTSAKKVTTF